MDDIEEYLCNGHHRPKIFLIDLYQALVSLCVETRFMSVVLTIYISTMVSNVSAESRIEGTEGRHIFKKKGN